MLFVGGGVDLVIEMLEIPGRGVEPEKWRFDPSGAEAMVELFVNEEDIVE